MEQDRPITNEINGPDAHGRSDLNHRLTNLNTVRWLDKNK